MVRSLISPDRLNQIRIFCELTAHLPGIALEVGVYQGGSLEIIAKHCPNRWVYGFDTFTGLPENDWTPGEFHRAGDFSTDFASVRVHFAQNFRNVTLVPGYFPVSAMPLGLSAPVAFAHLDVDFGKTMNKALHWLHPRTQPGSVILIDDWQQGRCPNVTDNVLAFLRGPDRDEYQIIPTVPTQAALLRL